MRCNIDFNYKTELERKIASLDTDIRELHNRKKSKREHDAYCKNLKNDIEEYWQDYEERINNLRIFYIQILKKQHKKSLKKFFKKLLIFFSKEDELKGIKDIESFCRYMQDSITQESKDLKGLLDKIEASMNDIKTDKQEKIANIIKDLEKIGQDILKTLKQVYKDINKHAKELQEKLKKHKDELEIQQGELHNHILKTKKEFKIIIKNFI